MSYCRFDEDSDIAAYNDGENILIDVARARPNASFDDDVMDTMPAAEVIKYIEDNTTPIGLPFDGARYSCAHAGDAIDRLLGLRDAGYRVPEAALDEIKREASLPTRASPRP